MFKNRKIHARNFLLRPPTTKADITAPGNFGRVAWPAFYSIRGGVINCCVKNAACYGIPFEVIAWKVLIAEHFSRYGLLLEMIILKVLFVTSIITVRDCVRNSRDVNRSHCESILCVEILSNELFSICYSVLCICRLLFSEIFYELFRGSSRII